MNRRAVIAVAALAATMVSCQHQELCFDHSHTVDVAVTFDWSEAPDASPASVSLYLYPADGGECLRYEFTDCRGGTIRVPIGSYDALCLNSDTENIRYANTAYKETFEVTTRSTSLLASLGALGVRADDAPRAAGTQDERVALMPDPLWTDHAADMELTAADAAPAIKLTPRPSVNTYTLEITNIDNLKYVSGIEGSLSSMAGGLLPGVGCHAATDERVTVPFEATVHPDANTVTATIRSFGHCPSTPARHILTIYAVLADGTKWYYDYDVSTQIHSVPEGADAHLVLDGLPFPKPLVNGGGFQPSVGAWQSVNIDLPM